MQTWVLLHYKIPREPTAPRVYVWRKLKRLGAILLQDAVWVLPATPHTRNAFFSARDVLTFYDTQIHAWYRLRLDSAGRPAELKMVAGAHFMHHDYSFRSPAISPPSR